jgi:hypothetical protein
MTRRMVFDVESVGLHGEGWALGYVVIVDGKFMDTSWGYCPPARAHGTADGRAWVTEHCPWATGEDEAVLRAEHGLPPAHRFESPEELRAWFWGRWLSEKEAGAQLWADVAWPVEARFLGQCVEDVRPVAHKTGQEAIERWATCAIEPTPREWEGPFPLFDVRSYVEALVAAGVDPGEVPTARGLVDDGAYGKELLHHPLFDARVSALKVLGVEHMLKASRAP